MGSGLLFLLIISFSSWINVATGETVGIACPIQSLYLLGDSISDAGNLVRMNPSIPATRLPYGETFPGRPTGRWSDGRLIIDFTAMALGLPLLNPYLDKNASFETGVNFAVAGSTALDSSFFVSRGIRPGYASLEDQLNWFKTHLTSICSTPAECADKLKKSLIFVGEIGGNDINYSWIKGISIQEIHTYVPFLNQVIINTTREIILAGALQIVVPGNFPVGCFPIALSTNNSAEYDELGCIKSLNDLVTYQNNNLQIGLDSLRREFPNVVIIYADYSNAFLSILRQASILGFDPTTLLKPCCQSRDFINPLTSSQFCGNSDSVPVCIDPNRYINWDGIHLTEAAYRRIFEIIIKNILSKIKCIELINDV